MTIYVFITVNFIQWTLVGMLGLLVFCQSPSRLSINSDSSKLACRQPGSVGPGGVPGASGSPGTMGLMGPPGKDGPDGSDGIKGAKGVSGDSGRPGNEGKPGVKGRKGSIGKTGPSGQVGHSGASGEMGQRGAKGERGDEGEQGPPGRCNCGRPARSAFSVAPLLQAPEHRLCSTELPWTEQREAKAESPCERSETPLFCAGRTGSVEAAVFPS
uniref:Uncharacterized protein n=1 Tax=Knipowitschia caucasica TaxID=637954 RepID=A0AAV2MIY1_KNICA